MRPKGRLIVARSQVDRSICRLVATAIGTIGRPEWRASWTMPSPATRETFGTSAVIATLAPSFRQRIASMKPRRPPRLLTWWA